MAKLGDVATYINGFAFKPTDWSDEGLPIIRIQDLTGNSYKANRFNGTYLPKYEVNNGDVLISWSASLGVYVWKGEKAVLNQHIFKVVFDKCEVDKSFFVHQVQNILENAADEAHGATMKHLTKPIFDALPFYLPNMEIQKEIASVLDEVSNLIALRNDQLVKLDELVKSRFIELFGGADYPKVLFENVCVFLRNGASIKQTKGAGGYPITRIETLSNDAFNIDRLGYADITDLEKYQSYVLHNGDILISHINSVVYLGRAVQYRGQLDTPIIHGMNLLCARIADSYNPTYIEWFFKTPMAKEYISTITKKAVNQASITTSDLKKMQVPNPPKNLQDQFAAFVEQTDKSKLAIQQSLDKLETLKKSLMQEYFG